jgi:hypothetical protein
MLQDLALLVSVVFWTAAAGALIWLFARNWR